MAKKITLTVNESLFQKIDTWRSSFNLSRLFQDAVTEAINQKENLQHRLAGKVDLPRIIERLKAEKLGVLEKAGKAGEADGSAWAGRAHYSELVQAIAEFEVNGSAAGGKDEASLHWEAHPLAAGMEGKEGGAAREAYRDGWRRGVRGLWDLVKDQLTDA
ncbi:MAG: hypothetical protein ACOYM2_01695 [Rectinemataceae bacterium]